MFRFNCLYDVLMTERDQSKENNKITYPKLLSMTITHYVPVGRMLFFWLQDHLLVFQKISLIHSQRIHELMTTTIFIIDDNFRCWVHMGFGKQVELNE